MAKITTSPADTSDTYDIPEYWKPIASANVSLPNFTFPFAFGQRATDYALNGVLIVVLIIVMISLGCTMEISKIKANFWKPKGVVIAVVCQYGIMPLTAFALGKLFQLDSIEALAVLICGCCPGGNLSNIFSLASKGDMNLSFIQRLLTSAVGTLFASESWQLPFLASLWCQPLEPAMSLNSNWPSIVPCMKTIIVMTACSTLLALGLMPLLLYLYSKGLYQGHLETKVPYKGIVISLVMTLIPCALGVFLNEKKPQCARILVKAGMIVLLLSSVPIIALSVINVGNRILTIFSPHLLGTSALMPFIGFSLGYILAAFFNLNDQCRRTICMEIGCQNVQLCSTILKLAFAPEVIGPLFFFPLLYILFQLGEGLLFVVIFRSYGNAKQRKDSATMDNTEAEINQAAEIIGKERNAKKP